VQLLPDLVEHLNPMKQWESLELEAALADAFARREYPGSKAVTSADPEHEAAPRQGFGGDVAHVR